VFKKSNKQSRKFEYFCSRTYRAYLYYTQKIILAKLNKRAGRKDNDTTGTS